jgi:hypothetical protein
MLLLRLSEVRIEFDMSTSDNTITASPPTPLPVFSENEKKQQLCNRLD